MEARSIGNTRDVLCVLAGHNGSCRGAIAVISTAYGSNAQEGIRNITPEIWVPDVDDIGHSGNALYKVGIYENKPLQFTDRNGEVKGIFVDVLNHIASREGWCRSQQGQQ